MLNYCFEYCQIYKSALMWSTWAKTNFTLWLSAWIFSVFLKPWGRVSLTPHLKRRRWDRSSWLPSTSPGKFRQFSFCLELPESDFCRGDVINVYSEESVCFKQASLLFMFIIFWLPLRLPLSIVECSQFLGICALPGKVVVYNVMYLCMLLFLFIVRYLCNWC